MKMLGFATLYPTYKAKPALTFVPKKAALG